MKNLLNLVIKFVQYRILFWFFGERASVTVRNGLVVGTNLPLNRLNKNVQHIASKRDQIKLSNYIASAKRAGWIYEGVALLDPNKHWFTRPPLRENY